MFQESFNELKEAELALSVFAKKSEEHLYPIIDKAIEDGEPMPALIALVSSLPVEESRYKYLDITSKISVRLADKAYFIDLFYTDELEELMRNLDLADQTHIDLVMSELNKLMESGNWEEAEQLTNRSDIEDTVKLFLKGCLIKRKG